MTDMPSAAPAALPMKINVSVNVTYNVFEAEKVLREKGLPVTKEATCEILLSWAQEDLKSERAFLMFTDLESGQEIYHMTNDWF